MTEKRRVNAPKKEAAKPDRGGTASSKQRRESTSLPPREVTRREALLRMGSATAAAAGTVGVGVWLLGRPASRSEAFDRVRSHRVERGSGHTEMVIARGPDPATNVRKALAAMGGMEAFVRPGDRVVIKPNVGWNRLPAQAATTDPEAVAEVVRHVLGAQAKEIWVTDVSVNNAERCFARSGIADAAGIAGAKVVLPSPGGFRKVLVEGELLTAAEILWPFVEADKVINMPIVKQHGLCGATLSMKNWYGVLGGHRGRLHQDIHRSIVDLAAMMKPTLTVLDATRILMANGPSGGSLDDVKRADTIAVSVDEVALDAFGAGLLGISSEKLEFLSLAERAKLGTRNHRDLRVVEIAS